MLALVLAGCLNNGSHPVAQTGDGAAPPGLWRTSGNTTDDRCRWQRTAGDGTVISSGPAFTWDGPQYAQLAPSDASFDTQGCQSWIQIPGPYASPFFANSPNVTTFGAGAFLVGYDILPGTYRSAGADMSAPLPACAWWRLSGFGGTTAEWIEYRYTYVQEEQIVTIAAGDRGFASSGCTPWVKIG